MVDGHWLLTWQGDQVPGKPGKSRCLKTIREISVNQGTSIPLAVTMSWIENAYSRPPFLVGRVPTPPGKSWNFSKISSTWKVLESDFGFGKS